MLVKEGTTISTKRAALIIVLVSLLLMTPAFLLGAGGFDLHTQSLWTKHFSHQLWGGELYPRWLQDMFAGDGSPVFFYYPPLAYYITALFSFASTWDAFSYYPMVFSALLATICSGFAFYFWAEAESGKANAALLGSLLYLSVPNHITVNFYQLLLFSSLWSYVWIPLLMWNAKRLVLGERFSVPTFAILIALLILTNLPMTVMFGPAAVVYGLLYYSKEQLRQQLLRMGVAVLLGFGMAAIYLLPALLYMGFANVNLHWQDFGNDTIWSGSENFFGFDTPTHYLNTFYYLTTLAASLFYFRKTPPSRRRLFFFALSLLSLVMMIPYTQFLWRIIPGMKLLQFAERLFALSAVCLPILAVLSWQRTRTISYGFILLSLGCTVIIACNTRMTLAQYHKVAPLKYEHYLMAVDQYPNYLTSEDLVMRYGMDGIEKLRAHNPLVTVIKGDAKVEVTQWAPRSILIDYHAQSPSKLRVRQFDYPGFEAQLNSQELEVSRDEGTGEILIDTPQGAGILSLTLTPLLPETAGKLISMIAALICMLLILLEVRRRRLSPITT